MTQTARATTALSRRNLLRSIGLGALTMAGAPLLASCGSKGVGKTAAEQSAVDLSATEKRVTFSNFPLYIDADASGAHPTLQGFTQQTGIAVDYREDINDDEAQFAKLRPALSAGNAPEMDLFMTSGAMIDRYRRLGWIQPFDTKNMPNRKNLLPGLEDVAWDPGHIVSLPWQNYFTGIAYDSRRFPQGVETVDDLMTPVLDGRVLMFNTMPDTMGLLLLSLGKDPSRFSDDDFDAALDKLKGIVSRKHVKQFAGSDYIAQLAKGSVDAAFAWSGDIVQIQADNPHVKFVFPQEGCIISASNLVIPAQARHKTNAEKLVSYYYDPEVAARLSAAVAYMSPVAGAQQAMEKINPKLAASELIFPDEQRLATAHGFMSLTQELDQKYNAAFSSAIGL